MACANEFLFYTLYHPAELANLWKPLKTTHFGCFLNLTHQSILKKLEDLYWKCQFRETSRVQNCGAAGIILAHQSLAVPR